MTKLPNFMRGFTKACVVSFLAVVAIATTTDVQFAPPFGEWERLSPEPIVVPQGDGFESAGTFNPAVIKQDGKFVMLYRAQDRKGTSSLGYGSGDDGIHFVRRAEPVMSPDARMKKGVVSKTPGW